MLRCLSRGDIDSGTAAGIVVRFSSMIRMRPITIEPGVWFIFRDATAGARTQAAQAYLRRPQGDGRWNRFNRAYNPPYSFDVTTCALLRRIALRSFQQMACRSHNNIIRVGRPLPLSRTGDAVGQVDPRRPLAVDKLRGSAAALAAATPACLLAGGKLRAKPGS